MLSRVIALGMFPGETVSLLNTAPLGDPLQLKAGETYISMRKKDAQLVQVQPL
jgi:ferrous iron transport protein A